MSKNRLLFTHSCNAVEVINAHTIGRIEELAGRYQELVREYPEAMRATGQAETAEQVFNSNAIGNSTLTLQDTEDVLSGIARKGLQLREVYEAKNLAVVVESQLESVDKLSVDTILRYHSLVLRGIADERAGRFRRNDEWVRTGGTLGANPAFVATLVEELVRSYPGPDHFLAGIAQFHLEFEIIHPFLDGNGRVGRILINHQLAELGLPPVIIPAKSKEKHYYPFFETMRAMVTRTG